MFLILLAAVIVTSFAALNAAFYALKVDAGARSRDTPESRGTRALAKAELANYLLGVAWCVSCLGYPFLDPDSALAADLSQSGAVAWIVGSVMVGGVVTLSVLRAAQRIKAGR